MNREAIEAAVAAAGSKITYTGAGTTLLAWLASSQFGVLFGIALGVIGLLVNLYFKYRTDKREHAEHVLRMRKMAIDTAPLGIKPEEQDE
ncbi:MAG: hypothetical protein H7255_16310 [Ramlibacter sp.]|nr:hypothetical protein [Ramlibacter sp.]